jgi:hypothetical protein
LPNGELEGCTALWEPCSSAEECCQHGVCDAGSVRKIFCHCCSLIEVQAAAFSLQINMYFL